MSFDVISAGGAQAEPAPVQSFLYYAVYDQCEGKDVNNYTILGEFNEDITCDISSLVNLQYQMVQCSPNGDKASDPLQILATSTNSAGSYHQADTLCLVSGGPLQGKYIYERIIYLAPAYLKKCSSVLGYSYVSTKSATLLINDKLDLNVLISPTGGYEVFKKGCTTVCNGQAYFV